MVLTFVNCDRYGVEGFGELSAAIGAAITPTVRQPTATAATSARRFDRAATPDRPRIPGNLIVQILRCLMVGSGAGFGSTRVIRASGARRSAISEKTPPFAV